MYKTSQGTYKLELHEIDAENYLSRIEEDRKQIRKEYKLNHKLKLAFVFTSFLAIGAFVRIVYFIFAQ